MVCKLIIKDSIVLLLYFLTLSAFGLQEENVEASMLFVQLPPTLPMIKRSATADGPEVKESSRPSGAGHTIEKTCRLDELPAGYMGKVLVYRSGAVKLKLGDILYDVSHL